MDPPRTAIIDACGSTSCAGGVARAFPDPMGARIEVRSIRAGNDGRLARSGLFSQRWGRRIGCQGEILDRVLVPPALST